MAPYLFTSESVAAGHPDKIADQISDAILDACLEEDPNARVACEVMVSSGLVIIVGEITIENHPDYQKIARETIREIGYNDCSLGFDYRSCGVLLSIDRQSPEIAKGVEEGAGDQGIVFGYASDETEELMPMPIALCNRIVLELHEANFPFLRPDGKVQVTLEYDEEHRPVHIHTIVLSVQHTEEGVDEREMRQLIERVVPKGLFDEKTRFHLNPAGTFLIGGPVGDCGLTGRKVIVDTYGGMGRHGGGSFSGKDPTKVDRSAAYAARYVAKNIVAAKLAKRCEVQLSYGIGLPYPISIKVETFGTSVVAEEVLEKKIPELFDLSAKGMIEMLNLRRPIYRKTAFGGHFGREIFPWEKLISKLTPLHPLP